MAAQAWLPPSLLHGDQAHFRCCLLIPAGAAFYGPDGVYPFAGKECAYAFAKVSTEVEDCHSNLEDLSKAEEETLLEWEGGLSEPPPGAPLLADPQPTCFMCAH